MAIEETGPGAGVAAADTENQNRQLQYAMLQQQGAFRAQELMMRMQELMHQNAVLQHQTAQQQYEAVSKEGEGLRTAVGRHIENMPPGAFDENAPGTQAVIGHLIHQAATQAAAFTNAFGGDANENFDHALNNVMGTLQATTNIKVNTALTDAFVKRAGLELGLNLKIPQLEGATKGETDLAAAQSGGAAAAGLTEGAKSGASFHAIQPGGSLVQPNPGGAAGVTAPGVTAAVPQAPAAAPVAPVIKAPAIAPAPALRQQPAPLPAPQPVPAPQPQPAPTAPNGARVITPMSPGEAAATTHSQEEWQKLRGDFRTANGEADKMLQTVEIMAKAQQLASTGMFAGAKVEMQRLVNALGLGDTVNVANVADNQTFNKAAFQLAIAMTHQLSARPSQLEFTGAISNTPNPEMDPRAASVLMDNLANAAYHLKDQYAAFEQHGAKNAFPSGAPNFEGFDQAWAIKNPLSSYSAGGANHKPAPGTPASGVRMVGVDAAGKPVAPGMNPVRVEEWHKDPSSPSGWRRVDTH